MQTKSRRAFLAGTATTVTAIAAGCAPVALAATSPDAELIRLGAEFDQAEADWIPLWREWQRHERLWRETLDARDMSFTGGNMDAVMAVFDDAGGRVASEANDAALARLDRIAEQIKKLRPTTLAGLSAWAKVARFDGVSIHAREKPANRREHQEAAILDFLGLVEELAVQS